MTLYWPSRASIRVTVRESGLALSFAINGDPVGQYLGTVQLPCHFGGYRTLFVCPSCCRRARFVYLARGRFVCRRCTGLKYWTQTASPDARMTYRIRRTQKRLAPADDPEDYVLDWVPDRPRGMRRATYRRLVDRLDRVTEKRDGYLEPGLLRLLARLIPDDELAALLGEPT